MGVVDIDNLRISFATDSGTVEAVKDVSLSVEPGEVLAIVGESGSGKTVTAHSILRLLAETASIRGAVVLSRKDGTGEHDVVQLSGKQMREIRGRDAAMVFQEPGSVLNPVYKVGWQIIEGLRAHGGLSKGDAREKAIDVLRRVGIPNPEERIDHYPPPLSRGAEEGLVIPQGPGPRPGG